MDQKMLMKDLLKLTGDQIFEQHSVCQKRIKRYEELIKLEKERLSVLTDILYNGKQIEEEDDDGIPEVTES